MFVQIPYFCKFYSCFARDANVFYSIEDISISLEEMTKMNWIVIIIVMI